MLPITLTKHSIGFYLMQAFGFIIISGIGFGISSGSAKKISGPEVTRIDYVFFAIGLVFVFLAFYIVIKYFRHTPNIKADESTITFGSNEVYQISDISDIQLSGKFPLRILFDFPMEATALHFKDGSRKYIYDDLYANSWQLKSFLEQIVVYKKPYEVSVPDMIAEEPDLAYMEVFKGNPAFSFRGIILWGLIGFMLYLTFFGGKPVDPKVTVFFIGLSIFLFLMISLSMNYFGLTSEYLIVKNHHFIWKKHFYKLSNIKEIVYETQPKATYALRLITRDFKTKKYAAGTLRAKHWLELMDKLQEKGKPRSTTLMI